MAKDPAFLFYPGDYLRDTQCLSEASQVAYDRIMCEHMRNIPISKERLNFFTKRLTDDQKEEIQSVLALMDGGFCIEWVHASLIKRRAYSESRAKNRSKSHDEDMISYVPHMENANENVNESQDLKKVDGVKGKKGKSLVRDNPPTIEEIRSYCIERKNLVNPVEFFDSNTAVGWVDKNGNAYRDWKAVIRKWEAWQKATAPIKQQAGPSKRPIAIVVLEKIVAKMSDHEILHQLIGTYSEHDINEALMSARGKKE